MLSPCTAPGHLLTSPQLSFILVPEAMQTVKKTIFYVVKQSIPILIGFFPIGVAYGVLMRSIGYNTLWSGLCSVIVFSGSLQFLMVDFLKNSTPLFTVAVMAALLNSRHLLYGLSFIDTRTAGFVTFAIHEIV